MVDHYTKLILTVIALALIGLLLRAGSPAPATAGNLSQSSDAPSMIPAQPFAGFTYRRNLAAAPNDRNPQGARPVSGSTVEVPRAWGRFVGAQWIGGTVGLAFEAADGTVRLVPTEGPWVALTRK